MRIGRIRVVESSSRSSSPEPGALVERLVNEFGLRQVVSAACLRAGIAGREEQVAYCLVALVQKHERSGSSSRGPGKQFERLHLARDDFGRVLAWWADEIAEHLGRWGPAYEAIHEEADRSEIETLLDLMNVRDPDELRAKADHLLDIVANAPSLDEMSLDLARSVPPRHNDYVFQSPLPGWITLSATRVLVPDTEPLIDDRTKPPDPLDVTQAGRSSLEEIRDLARAIGELAETRLLLADAIDRAQRLEAGLERWAPADPELLRALRSIRAEFLHEADTLARERRALPTMLAYVVLAARDAAKLQAIAILSLSSAALAADLRDHLRERMRQIVEDEDQPTAGLIARVRSAGAALPGSRARALDSLAGRPEGRRTALEPVRRRLDELPPVVTTVAAIGDAVGSSRSAVSITRGMIVAELDAVERSARQVFCRYARMRS